MLSSPVGAVEGTEEGCDDVCNPLGCVKVTGFWSGKGSLIDDIARVANVE